MKALFTKKEFLELPTEFKLGAIISDGMWYSQTKWRKIAKVTEEEIEEYIQRHLESGELLQSETEEKSFRFTLEAIQKWHYEHNIGIEDQIVDFLFPAADRIWDGMTEVDGFKAAPRRELGSVSFICSANVASEVIDTLKGVARVREDAPGEYRAYGLSAVYMKAIVDEVMSRHPKGPLDKTYARHIVLRRELSDFTEEFKRGLTMFYKNFSRSLVESRMSTIAIFLPEKEDQESQIIEWVIAAVEKFDEQAAVPFSGYLNSVLRHWPMDLPIKTLGKPLAEFQKKRAKALEELNKEFPDKKNFTYDEISENIGMEIAEFAEMEDSHRVWTKLKNSTTLTWDESAEEKETIVSIAGGEQRSQKQKNVELANKISTAIIESAIDTELFDDAYSLISQLDSSDLNFGKLKKISSEFIQDLGLKLGVD